MKRGVQVEDVPEEPPKRARGAASTALVVSGKASGAPSSALAVREPRRTSRLAAPTMILSGHDASVLGFRFSPSGTLCASASADRTVLLWPVFGERLESRGHLRSHKLAVTALAWRHDETAVYTSSADKTAGAFDVATTARVKTMRGHTAVVNDVATPRRGEPLVLSASDDRTVKLWDVRSKDAVHTVACGFPVLTAAFSDDGSQYITAGIDGVVKFWDARATGGQDEDAGALAPAMVLEGHTEPVTGLCVSPRGDMLLTTAMDNEVRMWDIQPFCKGDRCLRTMQGVAHTAEMQLLRTAWSSDSKLVASGSSDGFCLVWAADTGKLAYKLPGHAGSVNAVDFHPREPIIGSGSSDTKIFLGELADE